MRAILITLFLYITAIPVQAENWRDTCGKFSELATAIMKNRQSGVSMAKMMEAVAGEENSLARGLAEELIISAYNDPRYSTEEMQKRRVEEFRDEFYLTCVKTRAQKQ